MTDDAARAAAADQVAAAANDARHQLYAMAAAGGGQVRDAADHPVLDELAHRYAYEAAGHWRSGCPHGDRILPVVLAFDRPGRKVCIRCAGEHVARLLNARRCSRCARRGKHRLVIAGTGRSWLVLLVCDRCMPREQP